jgi:hypothetical protein
MTEISVTSRRAAIGGAIAAAVPLLVGASPAMADVPEGTLAQYPSDSARNVVQSQSAAVLPLAVQATAGQTANLQEWRDPSGSPLMTVGPNGRVTRPTDAQHAPYVWELGGSSFNGVFDPTSYFGYNVADGGVPVVPNEPYAAYVLEADYHDGAKRTMEQYHELRSADGSVNVRPLFFQVKRDATTPQDFLTGAQIVGNPLTISAVRNGAGTAQQPTIDLALFYPHRAIFLAPLTTDDNYVSVKAAPNYNAGLRLGQGGTDNVFVLATASSTRVDMQVNSATPLRLHSSPMGAASTSGSISVGGVSDTSAVGVFAVNTNDPVVKGLVARGRAGQIGSLFEVQNKDGAALGGFDKNGYFFSQKSAAPADADVATGHLKLWFDAAQGRLMVKARDASGRIRAGSVNLQ